METRNSFSIDFITRKCKTDIKNVLIYARITVNGERKEISIKEKIDWAAWNPKAEMVNGRTIEDKTINNTIDNIRFRTKEKYRALEDKGVLITAESVKNAYLGIQLSQRGHKMTELLEYFIKMLE
jgi:integrase/recombinase XerD